MSRAEYLAKNYLTADKPTEKKGKKRKRKEASTGLTIAEDNIAGWTAGDANLRDRDDDPTTVVSGQSAEFRKSKKNNWKTVGVPAPSNSDQAAADAIIAAAARETRAADEAAADEAPEVVETDDTAVVQQKMADGTHAGLQTKEQVAAALAARQAEEQAQLKKETGREVGGQTAAQETIYRDASGRMINVAMKRAEARRQVEEAERKKRQEVEERKGDVQRTEQEKRRQELEDAKYMTVARYADDKEMNAELKERERWNDPAAGFLVKKKSGRSATGKPLYKGAFAPNRYGIRPGHRWDGVDRSNGFEKKYFAARNRRENVKDLEYAWQMDE